MTIGIKLKEWRTKKRLKQDSVCSLLGMPFSTYQKYENDLRKPGADALEAFYRAGINVHWLLTGEGEMLLEDARPLPPEPRAGLDLALSGADDAEAKLVDEFSLLPFYNVEASAGHGSFVDQEVQTCQMAFRKDWLKLKGLQASKCALIKAKGDSMEPTIYDGDLLLIDTCIDHIKDDSIYILQTDSNLIVISDNPRYKERIITPDHAKDIKIVGRVRWYGHEI